MDEKADDVTAARAAAVFLLPCYFPRQITCSVQGALVDRKTAGMVLCCGVSRA
jgi:hypothetical protein